ncbi:MAG: hypothetical protein HFI16_05430 [Lachnospiraceae bacterium]|nr:hypothetical protein [Lachnospiraceae bacterium]
MQQLIKITSVPMRTMSYTQNARLVRSDSVDMERRKALARRMSFHRNAGRNFMPMKDITKINRTFSRHQTNAAPKGKTLSRQETAYRAQNSVSQMAARSGAPLNVVSTNPEVSDLPVSDSSYAETIAVAASFPESTAADISMENSSSYAAELGALEMRVAKGELTFLPPMVMTIVTQYPELHFEYLGDFNYIPPRNSQTGGNINLAT